MRTWISLRTLRYTYSGVICYGRFAHMINKLLKGPFYQIVFLYTEFTDPLAKKKFKKLHSFTLGSIVPKLKKRSMTVIMVKIAKEYSLVAAVTPKDVKNILC